MPGGRALYPASVLPLRQSALLKTPLKENHNAIYIRNARN